MGTVHIEFYPVKHRVRTVIKCKRCGKRTTRGTTIVQTINPFNKLADGTVKDMLDIQRENRERAEKWRRETVLCAACEGDGTMVREK